MTLSEYNAYFAAIAAAHVQIGAARFASVGIEEILAGLRTTLDTVGGFALLLEMPEGRLEAANNDSFRDVWRGAFQIVRAVQPDNFPQALLYMSEAKEIGLQIVARMFDDRKNGTLKGFDPSTIDYMDIMREYDNAHGYRFEFSIWSRPIGCLQINNAVWNDKP